MSLREPISDAVGDYLKAIHALSRGGPASTNAIAQALGFTPASVSGMLGKLAEAGLVEHRPYRGATLTEHGRREAMRLIRRHRLVETFMIARLGYGWEEVHQEAEAIEHAISDRFAERLAELLGHPTHDPHGDPIPRADGSLPATPNVALSDVPDGATLRVARLLTQDPQVLSRLEAMGVQPGAALEVTDRGTEDETVAVRVDGHACALPSDLARLVRGDPESSEGA